MAFGKNQNGWAQGAPPFKGPTSRTFLPQEFLVEDHPPCRRFHDGRIPRGRIVRICTSCPTWSLTWMVKNWSFLHKPMSWGLKGMLPFFPPEMMMDDDVDWVFLVAFYILFDFQKMLQSRRNFFKGYWYGWLIDIDPDSSGDLDMYMISALYTISVAITWVKLLVLAFVWRWFFHAFPGWWAQVWKLIASGTFCSSNPRSDARQETARCRWESWIHRWDHVIPEFEDGNCSRWKGIV